MKFVAKILYLSTQVKKLQKNGNKEKRLEREA